MKTNPFTTKTTVQAPLRGVHQVTTKSYKPIDNDKGGYLEVIFNVGDREYKHNVFPSSVDYMSTAIAVQLGVFGEHSLTDYLDMVKTKPIKVGFSYNTEFRRMNLDFYGTEETTEVKPEDFEREIA